MAPSSPPARGTARPLAPSVGGASSARRAGAEPQGSHGAASLVGGLSPRQREILEILSRGLTNDEIGAALGISATTVRTHVTAILSHFDVSNRTEAAALFIESRADVARVDEVVRRPAIAVLPFVVHDEHPRARGVAGGMAHDLAGLFARGAWFPVIASASTVTERAPAELGRDAGRRLGARFVVDGTLRMAERDFRLAVHIDDVDDGCCLWAERFDFPHAALFTVQDEICLAIVAAAYPVMVRRMQARLRHEAPPEDLHAWELAHDGLRLQSQREARAASKAQLRLERAIEREPDLVLAHFGLGLLSYDRALNQWGPPAEARDELLRRAERCLELAPHLAEGHYLLGRHRQATGGHEVALGSYESAIGENPSFAPAHAALAQALQLVGRADEALARIRHAIRLSPRAFVAGLANFHFIRGELDEALAAAERTISSNPSYPYAYVLAAASAFWLGDKGRAADHRGALRRLQPGFAPASFLHHFGPHVDAAVRITRALEFLDA